MARYKVGIQPLTWGETSFEQVCQEVAATGYDGIEAPIGSYLGKLDELKEILEANKLECASAYTGVKLLDPAKREEEIATELKYAVALKSLGCSQIVLSAPGRDVMGEAVPRERSVPAGVLKEYALLVNDLCRKLRDETGVKGVFHNHIGTIVERPEEIDLFMEYTDPSLLYAGFDTAQISAGGGDAVEYCARYASRIAYMHIKDRQLDRPTYGNFCELGLGFIHIPSILNALEKANYQGWLTVEVDQSLTTPVGSATVCREYLRTVCGV